MRVTVKHNRPPEEVKRAVEQAVDQLFREMPAGLIRITDQRKAWTAPPCGFG